MVYKLKNYARECLGAEGWTSVNAFPISTHLVPQVYHFYFRKLFSKADVLKAEK